MVGKIDDKKANDNIKLRHCNIAYGDIMDARRHKDCMLKGLQ
jgi:hypothetical protein